MGIKVEIKGIVQRYESQSRWDGECWVCIYCGEEIGHKYIATGHDHTDYSYEVCSCQGARMNGTPEEMLN
jgi:hypothetical protein